MRLAKRKSLVAGVLLLLMTVKNMFSPARSHFSALHAFNLVSCPVVSALCFWHTFKGRNPLLGKSEEDTSLSLGALSLIIGAGVTFAWLKYNHNAPQLLTALVFYAAAAFFFRLGLQERRLAQVRPAAK